MDSLELMRNLAQPSPSKIILLVLDGLGGLPNPDTGKTELETADTPNLNRLAEKGTTGLIDIVSPRFLATRVMPLAMAHALKLTKFGA